MKSTFFAVAAAALALSPVCAQAQNIAANPTYGRVSLSTGFTNDPYSVPVIAGGTIDASTLGGGCRGKIANAPDFELSYTAGTILPLTIYSYSSVDTTLVINSPNGQWYCIDDVDGVNPAITFSTPLTGTYDIWVGTYADQAESATLYISELGTSSSGGTSGASTGRPDFTAPPTFGSVSLTSGFTPDPYQVPLTAGGTLDASTLGAGCVGRIATAPDFSLTYTAGTLPLYITASSSSDTTLVVNTPGGTWMCDDDSAVAPTDPLLTFSKPASGRYDIWVGTYGATAVGATLLITEISGR